MYDEVYQDSQGRETPSVKIKVKNGNYRRQKRGWHWLPYEWFQICNSIPRGASASPASLSRESAQTPT